MIRNLSAMIYKQHPKRRKDHDALRWIAEAVLGCEIPASRVKEAVRTKGEF
jgi:hypothetical protein